MGIFLGLIPLLRTTPSITALTGAGVSQESGLRTFRDPQDGLWAQYRPENLATPEAFERDPELVWEFYSMRRLKAGEVKPNSGHFALCEMENHVPVFTLITQNVDGLHQRAGSKNVTELHGNISRVKCSRGCGVVASWEAVEGKIPACPTCGAKLRPDVVWFGETLPPNALEIRVVRRGLAGSFSRWAPPGWSNLPLPCRLWQKKMER